MNFCDFPRLVLVVCQQPERARLCSFKEENETIDRRPVDPPPVIELKSKTGGFPELLDSTTFFIRASLVTAEKSSDKGDEYVTVKTPTGADATAGEVIQTPERLRHLDSTPAALCIFAKLSVRVPGVFRLKFSLYETASDGIAEITHTISEPFEVFSPKLFKGMHESTPLTRHLATQGLKVKLRTDSTSNKGSSRRRGSGAPYAATRTSEPPAESHNAQARGSGHRHHGYSPALAQQPPGPSRPLVWQPHHAAAYPDYPEMHPYGSPSTAEMEPARKVRRVGRDGRDDPVYPLSDLSSRLDFSLPSPSIDLSAFSLGRPSSSGGRGRPTSAPGGQPFHHGPLDRYSPRRELGPGDDGLPSLPTHAWKHSSYQSGPPEYGYPRLPHIAPEGQVTRPVDPGPLPGAHHPHARPYPYGGNVDSYGPPPHVRPHTHHGSDHTPPPGHPHGHSHRPSLNAAPSHTSSPPPVLPPIRDSPYLRDPRV